MKVLVAYDGTLQSKDALKYGMEKVREKGGEVVVLHVFNSNMFFDYEAGPGAEELAKRESARYVEDARRLIREEGKDIRTSIFVGEGNSEEEILEFAKERYVDLLLCPPKHKSLIEKFREIVKERGREARESMILDKANRLRMAEVSVQ
jgi:nucleotide-binding universal stress UspA family protein